MPEDVFQIVPNGVSLGSVTEHPFLNGAPSLTVAHIGSLTDGKGWRIAADAVADLYQNGRNVRLLIAGAGPEEENARQLAEKNPCCIEYLGYVEDPSTTLLPNVDLLILMTNNDGLPMAIVEAMSCGVPVVSTSVGGIPNAVRNGRSGFIVPRSKEDVIKVLAHVHDNPNQLTKLGAAGLRDFHRRFEISRIVDGYESVYHMALNRTRHPRSSVSAIRAH